MRDSGEDSLVTDLARAADKLSNASEKNFVNPFEFIKWPERHDPGQWYFSPELISLYATSFYQTLDETARKELSFYECVNFFSLNIHGEKSLVADIAGRLHVQENPAISRYLHHFLDEENKHMIYFAGFCERYAGKVYPEKKVEFPRDYAPGEKEFLFYARVYIFEEIVDAYNARMARDERLAEVARQINRIHHEEEARHLAFGRKMLAHLLEMHRPDWDTATLEGIRDYLAAYLDSIWREYYNPAVYRDCGFDNAYQLYETAWNHTENRAHRQSVSEKCTRYFASLGVIDESLLT